MTKALCIFLAVLLLQLPVLALSTTEAHPGATIEATAIGDGLTLSAPHGFVISEPYTEAGVTHWRVIVKAAPRLEPYVLRLYASGVLVDMRGLRVCCVQWPDATTEHRIWLPFIQ